MDGGVGATAPVNTVRQPGMPSVSDTGTKLPGAEEKLDRFPSSMESLNWALSLLEEFVPASDRQTDAVIAVSDVISWMRSGGEYPRKLNDDGSEMFPRYIAATEKREVDIAGALYLIAAAAAQRGGTLVVTDAEITAIPPDAVITKRYSVERQRTTYTATRGSDATRASTPACDKVIHNGGGYLHDAEDDGPYDVDGVTYCGRCHHVCGANGRCEAE